MIAPPYRTLYSRRRQASYGDIVSGMFGINPSDLPWWGWILCGLGFAVVGWIVGNRGEESHRGFVGMLVSILLYMTGALVALIGIVQFIKWHVTGFL